MNQEEATKECIRLGAELAHGFLIPHTGPPHPQIYALECGECNAGADTAEEIPHAAHCTVGLFLAAYKQLGEHLVEEVRAS